MTDEKAAAVKDWDEDIADVDGVEIPGELAVLALRGSVLFPRMVLPLQIGRGSSSNLIDDVAVGPRILAVATQRDAEEDEPESSSLPGIGTACRILRLMKLPDGNFRVLVQGLSRVTFTEFTAEKPYLKARVAKHVDAGLDSLRAEALKATTKGLFRQLVARASALGEELLLALDTIDHPGRLADFVVSNLLVGTEEKQRVLEAFDVSERLLAVTKILSKEIKVAELQGEIKQKVDHEMGKRSREVFLREQLKAIRTELGEDDSGREEIEELRSRVAEAEMPPEAKKAATRELDRLARMHPSAAEYTVSRSYLDWLLAIPWSIETEDRLDVVEAKRILDEDHYGLAKVKDRILEYLSVLKLKRDMKGPILCLVGPPGVGKTSLGRSVARAMGRKFARISFGGVRDEAEIRGHRRTYVGALPGRIVQALKKAGTRNPVFMLDEVDKLGADWRGDPSSALLEVLDPAQNDTFQDHYLEVDLDLSRVLFIATANVLDTIPPPLRDRMEVISLPGYTEDQKLGIARSHLLLRQVEDHGLRPDDVEFTDEAIRELVSGYTREAGVRNLERELGSVCRKVARRIVEGEPPPFRVDAEDVKDLLGSRKFFSEVAEADSQPGVVTGLVWTPVGGEIIFLEATRMRGKKGLILTGSLGDVMKESAQAALSWVRANADRLGIDPEEFGRYDVHVHVPAGATPKDGPSAGVTIATAIVSLFSGRAAFSNVAMTGEITLRGRVLPVGGVKEKVLGALRAGIKTVVLPEKNRRDLEEIPASARDQLEFRFAEDVADVLEVALKPAPPEEPDE